MSSNSMAHYPLGIDYPREGFVQNAIISHFCHEGYVAEVCGRTDYSCTHPASKVHWHIEAKGETSQIGLDFRTGLGQLIQGISNVEFKYALAFPATDAFLRQAQRVAPWVRERLNLHWAIVQPDGTLRIIAPTDS